MSTDAARRLQNSVTPCAYQDGQDSWKAGVAAAKTTYARGSLLVFLAVIRILLTVICVCILTIQVLLIVGRHFLELSTQITGANQREDCSRNQVKQGRLRFLEAKHDEAREKQGHQVACIHSPEVRLGKGAVDGEPLLAAIPVQRRVKAQAHGHEDPRDDNVAQAKDRLLPWVKGHGKDDLNRPCELRGHRDHDLCAKNPEDVIDEEPTEEDEGHNEAPKRDHGDGLEREGHGKQVVYRMMLREQESGRGAGGKHIRQDVILAKAQVDRLTDSFQQEGVPELHLL
mmetsp:Transcript_29144/g.74032  ORF Transcript_29144/g.74032 Transcript_29144/m.74032 type:complete len:285 (+) Transcript_29144:56-910(+)